MRYLSVRFTGCRGLVLLICSLLVLGGAVESADAQIAVPATPRSFAKRGVGGGSSAGQVSSVTPHTPAAPATVRTITYTAFGNSRQWTSLDGKPLLAKLVAFEDVVTETRRGEAAPAPAAPKNPTVVRDGKVRLLSDGKAYEVPLERLSQADRDFVEGVRAAVARQGAAAGVR